MPEKIATFCKAHLSSLLHMDDHKLDEIVQTHVTDHNANKKNATTILSKKKERSASSTALSKELVYAMSKFVDYLSQSENLKTEGIFRKTGNVARQRLLKGLVLGNTGDFNLNDNTFSPHDVATVLKQILSEMPDPLLTHKHYEAHLKIADMTKLCVSEQQKKHALEKQIKSLQMLMLLLPQENAAFLETLLKLLHRTASCPENKMTATSLGVVFAPSIVCPRKLSAEGLQSASGTLSNAVTLMIENTDSIFKVPREIAADVANFWQERENPSMELLAAQDCNEEDRANIQKAKNRSSSAVNTVYMFAERKSPEEYKCAQDTKTVLSQLIAHVHSAKKLLKPLNRVGNVQKSNKKGNHSRSRSFGESIKKHLPLLSNVKLHNLRDDEELKLSVTSPVITENSVANITYLNTPYNKYTPVLVASQSSCPHRRPWCIYMKHRVPLLHAARLCAHGTITRPMSLVSSITQAVKTVPDLKKSITDPGFQTRDNLSIVLPRLNWHQGLTNTVGRTDAKDLCEIESQRSGPTEAERGVVRLRDAMPEKIATFCKAHLSSLLHMDDHKLDEIVQTHITDHNANKKNATTILSKKKERSASSTALSKELVYAMSKFVDYLSQSENLKTEGIFRKTGNVARQRLLKGLVLGNTGDFNLNDNTFSPHDVATVLKQILSEMPDPLLTHKHYEAHLKIADMTKLCVSEQEEKRALEKQIKSLQMLMLLLPQENAAFLETLLKLLHRTASCPENKMTATSLGVVFAPSIVCPRKLSAEGLQSASGTLSNAITLMIENTDSIFKVPREIAADVANFWQERENPSMELLAAQDCNEEDRANIQKAKNRSSSAVNTVYMFAERKSPEEYKCAQDTKTVLSQLIAHVHSAKKLLKPLNRVGNVQKSNKKGNHSRSRSFGESIKKHLPLLSNVKLHNLRDDEELKLSVTSPVITENSVANITYLNTPYNKYTPVLVASQSSCPHRRPWCIYMKHRLPLLHAARLCAHGTNTRPMSLVSSITQAVKTVPDLKKSITDPGFQSRRETTCPLFYLVLIGIRVSHTQLDGLTVTLIYCTYLALIATFVFLTKDLCEIESQRSGPTEAERGVVRLRDAMPEKIATFCKAHLSSLLHMDDHKLDEIVQTHVTDHNANKKNATTILSKKKERSASSTALSKELVYAMSKFVDYLSQSENLKTEGIFRKTGNVARQRLLKGLVLGNTGDFNLTITRSPPTTWPPSSSRSSLRCPTLCSLTNITRLTSK
ncbi:RHG19-like protein [Mya arenaria]|uniref:RHG19-like protein n=1 Tax=Mya arenaria TaxID=6604 RepID=A0ABY7DKB3_MYAAR|nr:RHG19-like protein [Mya arenaria]